MRLATPWDVLVRLGHLIIALLALTGTVLIVLIILVATAFMPGKEDTDGRHDA